jgi:ribonuclease HI/DNA-directed RNA polymerase subunit RPC12/RpoP
LKELDVKGKKKSHEPSACKEQENQDVLRVFIDGAGCRPDGNGSGFAWVCINTGEKRIERVSGLTNNQAEYRALISALSALPTSSRVELFSDSQIVCYQFNGQYKVRDPQLTVLLEQVRSLLQEKQIAMTLQWVPRARNTAGKLLSNVNVGVSEMPVLPCFLCGRMLEKRTSKALKPYFVCDVCGMQIFIRRKREWNSSKRHFKTSRNQKSHIRFTPNICMKYRL